MEKRHVSSLVGSIALLFAMALLLQADPVGTAAFSRFTSWLP